MTTRQDLEKFISEQLPGEAPFYTEFYGVLLKDYPNLGFGNASHITSKYSTITENLDTIKTTFETFYKLREIGAETVERFQHNFEITLLETIDRYEFRLALFKENLDKMKLPGRIISTDTNVAITDNDTKETTVTTDYQTTDTETFQDTPVTVLGSEDYATNKTDIERSNTGNMTTNMTRDNIIDRITTQQMTTHDKQLLIELNELYDSFKTIIIDFIKEFEICFMTNILRV